MNTVIHAAFRRDLARFDSALASFPAGSQERADQVVTAWDNFAHQLHHHHQDEETIFWPAFRELGADESLTSDLGGEHAQMLVALDHADEVVRRLSTDPSAPRAAEARAAVGELGEVLHEHLAHEESELEPWAGTVMDTPQFKEARAAVRKAHKGESRDVRRLAPRRRHPGRRRRPEEGDPAAGRGAAQRRPGAALPEEHRDRLGRLTPIRSEPCYVRLVASDLQQGARCD